MVNTLTTEQTMKRTTAKPAKKALRTIPAPALAVISGTRGAKAEIARSAKCSRAYVSAVLAGRRPCSEKLYNAITDWLAAPRDRASLLAMAQESMVIE